jgi:hypothetical protein
LPQEISFSVMNVRERSGVLIGQAFILQVARHILKK